MKKKGNTETPRIYVACLAAYNNGQLHGWWIDADDADSVRDQISDMLKASPQPNAEEHAIHDFEGFCGLRVEEYDGVVPHTREELLRLPGVGIKTANLTLNLGFNIDAICVDTHVHRISNRKGWISTKTPEESEIALQEVMPAKHWIPLNELLVLFGQQICTPMSPRCSLCPFTAECVKIGVEKHR